MIVRDGKVNSFCYECVGGGLAGGINRGASREVYKCRDRKCPFYRWRRCDLVYQDNRLVEVYK